MTPDQPPRLHPGVNPLELELQFCFALYSASHAMTKRYKPMLDKLGLTYPQYLVMLVLWEQDGILVKDIGARLFLDSGTLTPLLKRLEGNGLVSRKRDAHDERQVRIYLTQAGRSLRNQAATVPEQVLCASGEGLDTLCHMRDDLARIRNRLTRDEGQ